MSRQTDNEYMAARASLNDSISTFIQAAYAIGKDPDAVARDVADALCDASNRQIIFRSTAIE